jgi:hypothetical protein
VNKHNNIASFRQAKAPSGQQAKAFFNAERQRRYRARRDRGIILIRLEVDGPALDILVEARAVTKATADSGKTARIQQEVQEWLNRAKP